MPNYPIHTIAKALEKSKQRLNSCRKRLVFYRTFPQSLQIHRNSSTPWLACLGRCIARASARRKIRLFC